MTELREIDKTILHNIKDVRNDTQKITQETTLNTHRIRYSLKKLEKQGLISVTQPDQMVERVINGQKRVFQHPKQAQLTDKGLEKTEQLNQEDLKGYQNMIHRELVEKTRRLEKNINELENAFETFRKQVQQKIS